jgi:preprotein translocase subunit SecF
MTCLLGIVLGITLTVYVADWLLQAMRRGWDKETRR